MQLSLDIWFHFPLITLTSKRMSNGDFYAQHIFTLPGGESGKFRPAFAAQTPVNREKRPGPGEERNKNASDSETDTGGTGGPGCWLGWDQPPWVRASPGSVEWGQQSAQLRLAGAGSISPSIHWSQQTRLTRKLCGETVGLIIWKLISVSLQDPRFVYKDHPKIVG